MTTHIPRACLGSQSHFIPMPGSTRTEREFIEYTIMKDLRGPGKGTDKERWPIGSKRRYLLPPERRNR